MKRAAKLIKRLAAVIVAVLLGGLLAASLMRVAPGAEFDERQLDSRLSAESQHALRQERALSGNVLHFYLGYLWRAAHGDFGRSESLNQPIRTLIIERAPVTAKLTATGLVVGWLLASAFALLTALARSKSVGLLSAVIAGAFLCVPIAVLALLFVRWNGPAYLALAFVVFPRVYTYMRKLLHRAYEEPHLITTRAKGVSEIRVLGWHVLPNNGVQLLALAGVSVNVALGAAVPIEAICGIPGIGQLAWQAALGRDLLLLVTLTVIVSSITMLANLASEFAVETASQESA